ncbi:MAG TPA: squalene--hopene cyclase [Actinomycetota bacterium]|nr:squalene--hopene cyclase [Actinomycetota bacterium]
MTPPRSSAGPTVATTSALAAGPVDASAALERAVAHLLSLQNPEGWWKGAMDTNVTMDAEDLLCREFLGIRSDEETRLSANWIRSQQREDGTWANFYGGPGQLSTTVEAYIALRLAGDRPEADHLRRALSFIRSNGGLEATRNFTKFWCALFGLWSWDDLPAMPPEIILLPAWVPLNIYDWGCWARQTIVPLTVVGSFRPVRPLPFGIDELRSGARPQRDWSLKTWKGRFNCLDVALHGYDKWAPGPVRRQALALAERWIIRRQEADGGWGGIQPPWVFSLMALHLLGYPMDHPVVRQGLTGLDGFLIVEDGTRRMEACQSPVWDTGLAMMALNDAGVPMDHPSLARAAEWLVGQEVRVTGDWAVKRPNLEPGGWAFEFENDNYPDIDDTAEVLMALWRQAEPRGGQVEAAIARGINWLVGMQSSEGAWGAFDADNTRYLCTELPFCDFGAVIDPPSADVTAHAVEMLAETGRAKHPAAVRAVRWLLEHQEPDGSWFGRWGANYLYGTGAVVPALIKAGIPAEDPAIRRAVAWLELVQNADGGWGEDLRSYDDASLAGEGASTAAQTAWAMIGLLAAGEWSGAVDRGAAWLASTQTAEGSWEDPWFTGTGFPHDFYLDYHLYRLNFPVMALGRYRAAKKVAQQ